MWGVYECESSVEVAPCDDSGIITEGHILEGECYCLPREEQGEDGRLIVIHNSEN